MKYLLDTNICIFIINRRVKAVVERLSSCVTEDVVISTISVAELRYGASKSLAAQKAHAALDEYLVPLHIANFDEDAARAYGDLRAELQKVGTPIGPLDTLIGAHAIALGAILVTNNVREFQRIPGLVVEDWTR